MGAQMVIGSAAAPYTPTVGGTTNAVTGLPATLVPNGLNESYNYDSFGNILQNGGFNSTYTAKNQMFGYAYDAAGNLLSNGLVAMTWDAENRIRSTGGATYIYDAEGNRVEKQGVGVTDTIFFGGRPIARLAGGQWTDLVYGPNGLLAEVPGTENGEPAYRLLDHLGTEVGTVGSNGILTNPLDYTPFGRIFSGSTNDPYLFTGKERDTESGLDYFGARYYASNMGRFMTPDWNETPVPIPYGNLGDPQTLNLYAYVGNNPLSRTDPTGHAGQDQKLTSQSTIRVDAASADQVNVHVKTNSGEFRGRLNPDTKQIEWTKGAPPKQYAEAAQAYVLSKGKYDIAAAKQEMSVLGGTREGEGAGAGKLGEATNLAFALMQIVEIGTQAYSMSKINALEGTTGFHVQIDGSLAVTNLQKFGDTFGAGAGVKLNGDTFKLNGSGQWVDRQGNTLTQDKNGWHVTAPTV
jgi:RHS repeat-associated protein